MLRVGNFNTNDRWYYSNMNLPSKNYAIDGDLLYTWATAFGPHIWKGPKVIYHYHIWKLEIGSELNKLFLMFFLVADKAEMTSNLNGSTMVHITKGNMENKPITFPSLAEQKKIGIFFAHLDNLITLHQHKL